MKFVQQIEQLATTLAQQFGSEETHFNVQMRRGEDWITVDVYQNVDEPHRFHAVLDFDTGAHFLLKTARTIH